MDDVRDQMDIAEELSVAISTPMGNSMFDDDELEAELAALEDEDIDQKLAELDGLPPVPQRTHQQAPPSYQQAAAPQKSRVDDELAALEAEMAGL
jgi:charged multivesicular body protein 4